MVELVLATEASSNLRTLCEACAQCARDTAEELLPIDILNELERFVSGASEARVVHTLLVAIARFARSREAAFSAAKLGTICADCHSITCIWTLTLLRLELSHYTLAALLKGSEVYYVPLKERQRVYSFHIPLYARPEHILPDGGARPDPQLYRSGARQGSLSEDGVHRTSFYRTVEL